MNTGGASGAAVQTLSEEDKQCSGGCNPAGSLRCNSSSITILKLQSVTPLVTCIDSHLRVFLMWQDFFGDLIFCQKFPFSEEWRWVIFGFAAAESCSTQAWNSLFNPLCPLSVSSHNLLRPLLWELCLQLHPNQKEGKLSAQQKVCHLYQLVNIL